MVYILSWNPCSIHGLSFMKTLSFLKKHKSFVGVLLFALCFTCFSSHLTFADDNRLTIGSFNSSGAPVQLIIANENGSMASALATAINQTISNHSGDVRYSHIGGADFLSYVSYFGLSDFLAHSVSWFYQNNLFINVYGYYDSGTIYYKFVISKNNFVSQPCEWELDSLTGIQSFYDSSVYFDSSTSFPRFVFGDYVDVSESDKGYYANFYGYYNRDLSSSLNSYSFGLTKGNQYSPFVYASGRTFSGYSSFNTFDFSSFLDTFINGNFYFFTINYKFTYTNFQNSVSPTYNYGYNYDSINNGFAFPLASSFYFYIRNTNDFQFNLWTGVSMSNIPGNCFLQIVHLNNSLAVSFPYSIGSGALAYQNDFIINPTATPTPFPTYEPWDPNNPAGGSTPTPIPSGFGGITPTPIPSVSPPPATVTPINIFYNPVIDNGSDIWGTVKSIFDDFNGFFLGNEFIKFCSSLMNNVFYFDTHFMYFVIPVYICFIMFLIGRFRRK